MFYIVPLDITWKSDWVERLYVFAYSRYSVIETLQVTFYWHCTEIIEILGLKLMIIVKAKDWRLMILKY